MTAAVIALSPQKWENTREVRTKLHFDREDRLSVKCKLRKKAFEAIEWQQRSFAERKQQESTNIRFELIAENSTLKLQLREMRSKFEEERDLPESAFKHEYIQRLRKAREEDDGKIFNSIDDFFKSLEE